MQRIPEPRGATKRRNRKEPLAPEDQVNHIPVRRTATVPPRGGPRAPRRNEEAEPEGTARP